jgi:hypothetical protein
MRQPKKINKKYSKMLLEWIITIHAGSKLEAKARWNATKVTSPLAKLKTSSS